MGEGSKRKSHLLVLPYQVKKVECYETYENRPSKKTSHQKNLLLLLNFCL